MDTARRPVAAHVMKVLIATASHFAVRPPLPTGVRTLVENSFPCGNPNLAYRNNCLVPGAFPLECSYSTRAADTFRFTVQGFMHLPAPERLEASVRLANDLVHAHLGATEAREFTRLLHIWLPYCRPRPDRFGAFLGMGVQPRGISEIKIYLEVDGGAAIDTREWLPPTVSSILQGGLIPRFVGIAGQWGASSSRAYFTVIRDIDCPTLCACISDDWPEQVKAALAAAISRIVGPTMRFPAGSLMLAGNYPRHRDVKVEVSARRIGLSLDQLPHLAEFASRPAVARHRISEWARSLDHLKGTYASFATVVSFNFNDKARLGMTAYAHPSWAQEITSPNRAGTGS